MDAEPLHTDFMRVVTPRGVARVSVLMLVIFVLLTSSWCSMIRMPEPETLAPPTRPEATLVSTLRKDVERLADDIGERHIHLGDTLARAAGVISDELGDMGYVVNQREFRAAGKGCANLEVEIRGLSLPEEIVVVGAHYDSAPDTPGAVDNASGVAVLLALAGLFRGEVPERTLRFVAFANEEPPFFQTEEMGSLVYARAAAEKGENIVAMISLEMLGTFSDEPDSQSYPAPFSAFYPSVGNFISFVGNFSSRQLVRDSVLAFREANVLPAEGAAPPGFLSGVGWSDHWSFWQVGYPALMVTDTALFRNHNYHTEYDRSDALDYERMARVAIGLEWVMQELTTR